MEVQDTYWFGCFAIFKSPTFWLAHGWNRIYLTSRELQYLINQTVLISVLILFRVCKSSILCALKCWLNAVELCCKACNKPVCVVAFFGLNQLPAVCCSTPSELYHVTQESYSALLICSLLCSVSVFSCCSGFLWLWNGGAGTSFHLAGVFVCHMAGTLWMVSVPSALPAPPSTVPPVHAHLSVEVDVQTGNENSKNVKEITISRTKCFQFVTLKFVVWFFLATWLVYPTPSWRFSLSS